jgi:two-component system CheB/CheR fusion protein
MVQLVASAGGLEAVLITANLSPTTGVKAFIYVQHLSPDHKSVLPLFII